jgi:hypothetical protein
MKRIKLIFLILFLAFQFYSIAQTGSVQGHIINRDTSKPVPWVNIFLRNTKLGTSTNMEGNFVLEGIPAGVYDIQISHIEYGDTILRAVQVMADSTIRLDFEFPLFCKYKQSINNKTCPICHKKNQVIPIYYGYPSENLIEKAKNNKARLGGCQISNCMPNWYCLRDSLEF